MKELSIEEKAKRYDEAYKVAKNIHIFSSNLAEIKRMEEIFPELKEESEDERIKKRICKLLWDNAPYEEAQEYIAWLEKQGEQKATIEMKSAEESLGIDSDTYNKIVDECIYGEQKPEGKTALEAAKEEKVDDANKIESKDYSSIDPHFFKPVDKVEPKFKVGDNIEPIDSCLGSPRTIYKICDGWYETNQGTLNFEFENNWRLIEQKPAWSEEDERIYQSILDDTVTGTQLDDKQITWLKSPKDRVGCEVNCTTTKEWKPSDEQMDALYAYLYRPQFSAKDVDFVESLYQDLKKLKE